MIRITAISMLIAAVSITPATGQTLRGGWVLCTRELELQETLIDHIDERELILRSAYGIRSSVPMDQVLFLIRAESEESITADEIVGAPAPQQSPVRLVSLTDGQVIRGSINESDLPEELAFNLIAGRNVHGDARVPLERVLRISDGGQPGNAARDQLLPDDTLVTRTGDTIVGFIESIGPMTRVSIDDGGELEIETARLESIGMANPPAPQPGLYLTFNDFEVLRASAMEFDTNQPIRVEIDAASLGLMDTGNSIWVFDADSLRSLTVRSADSRIVALTEIAPALVEPTGDRDWVPSPVPMRSSLAHAALGSIDLITPMRVEYPLPEGSGRFASTIEASVQQWTDCIVRVIARSPGGSSTLFEGRLNAATPSAEINTLIPRGATGLIIEIDPGKHGPIQDRVLLHRPRLLIQD